MADTTVARFLERARRHPERPALRSLTTAGATADGILTWGCWAEQARRFAASLVASGHHQGQAVAVLAGNTETWPVAELGIMLAGGVSVGLYPTSAPAQISQALDDCAATLLVVEGPEQLEAALAADIATPLLVRGVGRHDRWTDWDAWMSAGVGAVEALNEVTRRAAILHPDQLALLIYTSGSTGAPKGARISHRYLAAAADSIVQALGLTEHDTTLSFLPFSHAAERVFGLHTRIACGMEAAMVPELGRVWPAAREYSPTLFGGLPRFYEKVYEAMRSAQGAACDGERVRWDRAEAVGRERSRQRRLGWPVSPQLEAEWTSLTAPFSALLREHFGGRMRLATSGGAPLPEEVAEYLDAFGVTVLGAYGLTEHLCVAMHRPERYGFDSAGPLMPGTEVRIAPDGEILVRRNALTFDGYHARPEDTRMAFSADGAWLHTGDVGTLRPDGTLRVTGRKKELIALSNGKKVAPLPIESRLSQEPWIGQAVLVGEGERYVAALLALRGSALERWAREQGLDLADPALRRHPELMQAVQASVDRVNRGLSRPEQVRRWAVLETELTAERGELTPTLKVRRDVVARLHRDTIQALYTAGS
jgi:long-chain acyl-CoA synthetase